MILAEELIRRKIITCRQAWPCAPAEVTTTTFGASRKVWCSHSRPWNEAIALSYKSCSRVTKIKQLPLEIYDSGWSLSICVQNLCRNSKTPSTIQSTADLSEPMYIVDMAG